MLNTFRHRIVLPVALLILYGCSDSVDDGNDSHYRAMQQMAITYGSQSGFHWKSNQISSYLNDHSSELDQVFNFNALLMQHNILPPVVAEYGKTYSIESNDTVRITDKEIRMVAPARFVSVAPSWRDYIVLHAHEPEDPPASLMPLTDYELVLWKEYLQIGWDAGVDQAVTDFENKLAELNRDFQGMILYHILHIQNMISAPYTETTNLGITGDSHGLRLNDKIIHIEKPSLLNPLTNQWHPILYDKD